MKSISVILPAAISEILYFLHILISLANFSLFSNKLIIEYYFFTPLR